MEFLNKIIQYVKNLISKPAEEEFTKAVDTAKKVKKTAKKVKGLVKKKAKKEKKK